MLETGTWLPAICSTNSSFKVIGRVGLDLGRYTFLIRVLSVMAVLLLVDIVAGVFFGLFFQIGYFSGKSIVRIVSDFAFIEGAVVFFAGAVLAFFGSSFSWRIKALMVLGASMVGLSVVFGVFS
jgi:hypothetical protein